jgi:hypothetical protein
LSPVAIHETQLAEIFGALTVAFLAGFWLLPGGVLALRRRAGGEPQVDVRPGYSPATLYRLLQLYGAQGIRMFRRLLLADMVFPAVYATFLYLLGDLAAAAHPGAARAARVVCVMAIAAASFDYLENLSLLYVLHCLPGRHNLAARAAGLCTSLKMLSFIAALVALASALFSPSLH